jgi:hypothetical protein
VPSIAVVHLVRRKNGIAPLERFLASYMQRPAGQPHELVMVFKGFPRGIGLADYERLLSTVPHRRLFVPDRGLDLNAYFTAVEQLDFTYFCFLNSYSRILAPDWLTKLYRWISVDGVGLVGATGSCQRIGDRNAVQRQRMRALPPAQRFEALTRRVLAKWRQGLLLRHAAFRLLRMVGIWRPARDFPPFPNYHLRTNAFMAARQTLRRIRVGAISTKLSAYKFESGNDSLTNQVLHLGLRVLVVGRDGEGYEPERWHLSNTFRQSRQENLLVTDNQTDDYEAADPVLRSELSRDSWGDWARPG